MPIAENILQGNGDVILLKRNGNTKDIINAVLGADNFNAAYVKDFANTIPGNNLYELCYNIWKWLRTTVPFVEDEDGIQLIQSPGHVYQNRYTDICDNNGCGTGKGADCKSYSSFISGCLKNLGIKHFYRFISEDADKQIRHVYICVPDGTKNNYIVIDSVLPEFDKELAYTNKKDIWANMNVAGRAPHSVIGQPSLGASAIDISNMSFLEYDGYLAKNIAAIQKQVQGDLLIQVKSFFAGKPIQKTHAVKLFNEVWPQALHTAGCLVYHFWDEKQARFIQVDDSDTPIENMRGTSETIYSGFKDIGCSDVSIRQLADIGVFYTYGISLNHMLNRCYNKVNFGVEWAPVPGVPYFDVKTGLLTEQWGSFESNPNQVTQEIADFLNISAVLPIGGGISRPYGTPYWCKAGRIIPNGANDVAVKAFVQQFPKPGFIPIVQSDEQFYNVSVPAYNNWLQGNMPSIPGPPVNPVLNLYTPIDYSVLTPEQLAVVNNKTTGDNYGVKTATLTGRAKIGLAPEVITAVITAIVTIVVAAINVAIALVNAARNKITPALTAANTPCPPQDFKLQYTSVDGCFIGTATAECPGSYMKFCPDGSSTCVTASDLTKPENQPGTTPGQGFFDALKAGSPLLLAGLGLLIFGLLFVD